MHINKLKKIVSIFIFSKNQLLLQLRDKKKDIGDDIKKLQKKIGK